jgi:3-phosphoshikimate 1-carboxyvinyltransferase
MKMIIQPGPLKGSVSAIPSKSHGHRLLIAAALSTPPGQVHFTETSEDLDATKACLLALQEKEPVLPCRESGSTLRFLLPVTMALKDRARFLGEGRLLIRPLSPLKEEMERHGCTFSLSKGELEVTGRLQSGIFTLPGDISSQYITGLLFALPLLSGDSEIVLTSPLESSGYVDLTLQVLEGFGIQVGASTQKDTSGSSSEELLRYFVPGGQQYQSPAHVTPEGDWSNGAVWIAANYVGFGNQITCTGLSPDSLQGDRVVFDLLRDFPSVIDASQIPDLIPILAVVAAVSPGITTITHAERLRLKESDRIETTVRLIRDLGGEAEERPDGMVIRGKPLLCGGEVDGCNDHRIVMAAAIASTNCTKPVAITGAEAVNKSYPGFFRDFKALGGKINEL